MSTFKVTVEIWVSAADPQDADFTVSDWLRFPERFEYDDGPRLVESWDILQVERVT